MHYTRIHTYIHTYISWYTSHHETKKRKRSQREKTLRVAHMNSNNVIKSRVRAGSISSSLIAPQVLLKTDGFDRLRSHVRVGRFSSSLIAPQVLLKTTDRFDRFLMWNVDLFEYLARFLFCIGVQGCRSCGGWLAATGTPCALEGWCGTNVGSMECVHMPASSSMLGWCVRVYVCVCKRADVCACLFVQEGQRSWHWLRAHDRFCSSVFICMHVFECTCALFPFLFFATTSKYIHRECHVWVIHVYTYTHVLF